MDSVFDLADKGPPPGPDVNAFYNLYDVTLHLAHCKNTSELAEKYGVQLDDTQRVVSITERTGNGQVWFNKQRVKKPSNFTSTVQPLKDPTNDGANCDFCKWGIYTAEDTFGRIEREHAVSASNLFKCCGPFHGVVLFKRHHPHQFTLPELTDLMLVSDEWFQRAHGSNPAARFPLLVWNCLSRAGASQFHGHAQVMLSTVPFPGVEALLHTADRYNATQSRSSYFQDQLRAHNAVGLLRSHEIGNVRAWCYASLTQKKDAEIVIQADSLGNVAMHFLLFCALRALLDRRGVECFNVGILNIPASKIRWRRQQQESCKRRLPCCCQAGVKRPRKSSFLRLRRHGSLGWC
eukprot:jgi/Botrbrau1/8330/Bobra.0081s0019.1